jgi:hypothetical protein
MTGCGGASADGHRSFDLLFANCTAFEDRPDQLYGA